jgi:hypothetical protein
LPQWTFSELIEHATAAEPRAKLDSIIVRRTVEGQTKEWTVNMSENGRVKDLPARIGDGDRIVIPLCTANDPEALTRRRGAIYQISQRTPFGERIFTRNDEDSRARTLCEFLMQTYLTSEMVIPQPDLSNITVHRLKGEDGDEEEIAVDLVKAIAATTKNTALEVASAADVPLQWGDVIEIRPGAGDPEKWTSLSTQTILFLTKALTRSVSRSVNGEERLTFELKPTFAQFRNEATLRGGVQDRDFEPFVLSQSLLDVPENEIVRVTLRSGDTVHHFTSDQVR